MQHKKLLSLAVSSALGLTASLMATGVAVAQEDQDENADDLLEEVIVTGSRIATVDGFGRTSPVTVVGMDEITSTGLTRVEDILNSLPQVETALHSFDANGISGTASIDLRGLGAFRTLVLMNGRRFPPGGVSATAVDVNQIPSAMIERVEVLTGGASATYGADAVAGVVNFIMRRVTGVEISAGISGYQHDNDNKFIQDLMDQEILSILQAAPVSTARPITLNSLSVVTLLMAVVMRPFMVPGVKTRSCCRVNAITQAVL